MKVHRTLVAAITLALMGTGLAQHHHFPEMKWKERQTDHFTIRTHDTRTDPAKRNAEDVWEECQEILPGMEDDFTKNEFRTPRGEKGSDEAPSRYTVYLLGTGYGYQTCLNTDKARYGWGDTQVRSLMMTGNYKDPLNRYIVICKVDPNESGGGSEQDKTSLFVHSSASSLLSGRARSSSLPFWMTAAWGYYIEHKITDGCRVLYLDFAEYYKNAKDTEIVKGGVLGPEDPWASPVKRLCRKDIRVSLEKVCNAKVITLSPNESGYIFALTYFLVSTDENRASYRNLVKKARDGDKITKEILLMTYGYEDDEGFEKDWYEFVESSKFK